MRSRLAAALVAALTLGMGAMPALEAPSRIIRPVPNRRRASGLLSAARDAWRRPSRGYTVRSDQRQAQKRANVRRNRVAHKRAARK